MTSTGVATDIRTDLARRIATIEWRAGPGRIAADVDAVRAIARRHGMLPVVTVAHLLASALSRGEHGALVHSWLGVLREAAVSERQDAAASDAFAAACHVRFAA